MSKPDDIRCRSGAFYGAVTVQSEEKSPSAELRRHNLALRDSLTAHINRDNFDLLDIGCGRGRVSRIVKDVFPQSKIFGVDISEEQIEHARALSNDAVFEVGNEISLPFGDSSFDYATCRMSIHHYPDMMSHLREVKRVLRPCGHYLIIDPVPSRGAQAHWLNEVFLAAENETSGDGHVRFYTIEDYNRFFAEVGLIMDYQEQLPHTVVWSKSTDYTVSIFRNMLRAPEEFRDSINFADEGENYRYELPTHLLGVINQVL